MNSDVVIDVKGRATLGGELVCVFDTYQPGRDSEISLINFSESTGDFAVTRVEGMEEECVQPSWNKGSQKFALLLSVSDEDSCNENSGDDSVDWRIIVGVVVGVVLFCIIVAAVFFWVHKIRSM